MDWRRIPSLSALRAFEAQARLGSFSAAARELNVTHAAIAQHVRSLETHFDTALVARAGRGVHLTEAGARLALALQEGFGTIETAILGLLDAASVRPLTISLTPSFAENWLMPRLGAFWARHPGIELALRPSAALVDLRADGVDLAIRFGDGDWPDYDCTPLVPAHFVVVATPALVGGRAPGDLRGLCWFVEAGMREQRRWAESFGLDLPPGCVSTLPTNALVLAATRAGHGLSIQPRALVERDLADGRLEALVEDTAEGPSYWLLTQRGRCTPKLDALVAWLRTAR